MEEPIQTIKTMFEGPLKTLTDMTAEAVEKAVIQLLNRQAARAGI